MNLFQSAAAATYPYYVINVNVKKTSMNSNYTLTDESFTLLVVVI